MKNVNKSRIMPRDVLSWMAMILVTIAAFFGTYYFHFSTPIKVLIWVGWLVLIFVFGFFTTQGKQVFLFAKEAKVELQKVVWPSRQETIQTTSIVMIMVAVTGLILWGIDAGMMWAIGKITHLG